MTLGNPTPHAATVRSMRGTTRLILFATSVAISGCSDDDSFPFDTSGGVSAGSSVSGTGGDPGTSTGSSTAAPEGSTGGSPGTDTARDGTNTTEGTGGSGDSEGGGTGNGTGGSAGVGSTGDPSGTTGSGPECPPGDECLCDGLDDDGNGLVDDVDVANDGFCDCLNIGVIGKPGFAPASNLGAFLSAQGTFVERTTLEDPLDIIDADFLSAYQVVLVEYLPRDLTPDEVAALETFVRTRGRGLMTVIGFNFDNNDPGPERDRASAVLAPFELAYNGEYLIPADETLTFVPGHPTTAGVTSIPYRGGIEVIETANPANGTIVGTVEGGLRTGAIAKEIGSGRVLVFGDEWLTFDSEWNTVPDVQPFWTNILSWLAPLDFCTPPPG